MPLAFFTTSKLVRGAALLGSAAAVATFAGCGSSSSSSGSGGGSASSSSSKPKLLTTATDGKAIFAAATCTSCHTLADAGSKGAIGPNLDNSKPSEQEAVDKLENGAGSMPSFKNTLSAAQITAVAKYVHDVTNK